MTCTSNNNNSNNLFLCTLVVVEIYSNNNCFICVKLYGIICANFLLKSRGIVSPIHLEGYPYLYLSIFVNNLLYGHRSILNLYLYLDLYLFDILILIIWQNSGIKR